MRQYLVATAVLTIVACLWFWPLFTGEQLGQAYTVQAHFPWAGGEAPGDLPTRAVFPDQGLEFYPWAKVARDQLHAGQLPLWNPYEYGGTALAGNMQSALYFPLSWLLLVLPLGYAWGAVAIGKLVIAGVGAFALSRALRVGREGALLAGAVYMLSAPMVAWVQWPLATVFAMFPWLLWATVRVERQRSPTAVMSLAIVFALTILAGHPETTLMAVSAVAVYLVTALALDYVRQGRTKEGLRTAGAWLAGLALGAAAAAVAILPFAEAFSPSISRTADSAFGQFVHLPRSYVLHYALPWLFGDGKPKLYGVDFYQSIAAYFGLPALVLAGVAVARLRRNSAVPALTAMCVVALMAAYGLPPISWVIEHVPPWSDSIIAGRANFIPALGGALAAGAGFNSLMRRPMALRRVAQTLALAGLAIGLVFGVAELSGSLSAPTDVKLSALGIGGLGLLATGVVLAAVGRLRPLPGLGLALALAVVSLADLQNLNVTLPPAQAYPDEPPALAALERQPGPFRVGVIRSEQEADALRPNAASVNGLETVEGYDFPLSKRWSDFQTAALSFSGLRAESRLASGAPSGARLTAMRMMNTRYYVAHPDAERPAGFTTLYRGPGAVVFRDSGALPRAYVVPRTRPRSYAESLAELAAGRLDPRRTALVPPKSPPPGRAAAAGFSEARVEVVAPDHVRVHLAPGSGGWLVLANAYHPNWDAEIDGRPTEVRPTDFAAMGVPVSPGARTVDFRLDRTSFWAGAAISAAALALIALLAAIGRRRLSAAPGPPAR